MHIAHDPWSHFARGLSLMYQEVYAAVINASTSVAPSVHVVVPYGAFTLTLTFTALARVVLWDVVVDVLQHVIAGSVCCGISSVLFPISGVER